MMCIFIVPKYRFDTFADDLNYRMKIERSFFQLWLIIGQITLCFVLGLLTFCYTRKFIKPIKVLSKYVEDLKQAQDRESKKQVIVNVCNNDEFKHLAIQHTAYKEVYTVYPDELVDKQSKTKASKLDLSSTSKRSFRYSLLDDPKKTYE